MKTEVADLAGMEALWLNAERELAKAQERLDKLHSLQRYYVNSVGALVPLDGGPVYDARDVQRILGEVEP